MSVWFQIVSGAMEGYSIELKDSEITVGRGGQNTLPLGYDPCLSTNHAVIKCQKDQVEVLDLASSNGTFVKGRKIAPHQFQRVDDHFVLGSTIFMKMAEKGKQETPITISQFRPARHVQPWLEKAKALATQSGLGIVNQIHLFFALIDMFPEEAKDIWNINRISQKEVQHRWDTQRVFEDDFLWLNDLYRFQLKTVPPSNPVLSAGSVSCLKAIGQNSTLDFTQVMGILFQHRKGLINRFLDWERGESIKIEPKTRDIMSSSQTSGIREQIFPERLWMDVGQLLLKNKLLILTGGKGCGKTSVMHRIFHPVTEIQIASNISHEPVLFDTKVFMVFNEAENLGQYLEHIMLTLGKPGLVGIDHFGHLLELMQEERYDRSYLLDAIRRRRATLMLTIQEENYAMIDGLFQNTYRLEMDKYLDEVCPQIYKHLIRQFEHRVRCIVSPQANDFFMDYIVKPSPKNFAAMQDFLALCTRNSHGIDFPFKELKMETRASGRLAKKFFRDVYDEWVGRTRTATSQQQVKPSAKKQDPNTKMLEVLYQLETLIHTFVKNEFKMSLHYSDQTRSLRDDRFLSLDQKIDELKSHLVVLFTAYERSFSSWFDVFWEKIGPDAIKKSPGVGSSPKKSWAEYLSRTSLIDTPYAVDHFHEIAARIFVETWHQHRHTNS